MEMKLFFKAALYSSTFSKHTQLCTYESVLILLLGNLLGHVFLRAAAAKPLQSCPTLCNPMDCSLPGSSVHGIFQARVLEWVAIAFSTTIPREV